MKAPLPYINLRSILTRNGIRVAWRQGLAVYQAVSSAIYEHDEILRTTANQIMSEWRHSRSGAESIATATHDASTGDRSTNDTESAWRRIDSAEKRFPASQKYSGILGESPTLMEVRRAYLTYCDQKRFPRADKVKLVSCILKGQALNFWTLNIEQNPEHSELGPVFAKLESQFDTPAHQKQIEAMAGNLTMELTRQKHIINRVAALGILYHEVARLNQQLPKEKRGEPFKVQTLMRIVEKYEWSRHSEEEVMRDAISYDELYTKFSVSLVVWEREISRAGQNPDTADDTRERKISTSFIGYGSHYAYPRNSTPRGRPSASYRSPSTRFRSSSGNRRENVRCFKCKSLGTIVMNAKRTKTHL